MDEGSSPGDPIYALVSYIPEPLAVFLDGLRRELVPDCFLRAHVTVLPPRPVRAPGLAWNAVKNLAARFAPFEVRLSEVEVFPVSNVIYVNVGKGSEELRRMHDVLAAGGLQFNEPFAYHPHVTLAQELKGDELDRLVELARARWVEVAFDKSFLVEKLAFVQNTNGPNASSKDWIDLAECVLGQSDSEVDGELTGLLAK